MKLTPVSAQFISRVCPNCCSSRSVPQVLAEHPADALSFEELKKYWYGFFKESTFFTFHRCLDCGLLFSTKYFSESSLAELYSNMPDNTAGQNMDHLKQTQQGYFQFLDRTQFISGNYFELGPDIGLFTENVARELNFEKYFLLEPNRAVHQNLSRSMLGKSHVLLTDLTNFSAIPDQSIALAVLIHVLDHVIDLQGFLTSVRIKMKPGASILIVTHDERSFLARLLKKRWPAYCLQHPHLFNTQSTKAVLTDAGFREIRTEKSVNHFTVAYLLRHLLWALGIGKYEIQFGRSWKLPLKLGNIITQAKI